MEKGQQQEGTGVEEDTSPFWLLKDVQSTPARPPWPRNLCHGLGTSEFAGESPPGVRGTQPLTPTAPLQTSLNPPWLQ